MGDSVGVGQRPGRRRVSRTLWHVLLTSFPAGPLQANCYFVSRGPGTGCAIVDPGMDAMDGVHSVVAEHNLRPSAVLVTHGHFDHMWCAQDVAREYDCPVWIHPADRHLLSDPMAAISNESATMLRSQLGMTDLPEFTEPEDVRDAVDGALIDVDGLTFHVDHVPGHTPGTVFYRVDYDGPEDVSQVMFSGDFLFAGSIGRTDLNGGSHPQMIDSLRDRVLPLDDDIVVLPGHGSQTSIGRERATNPFLAELIA
jgi:hydroxyacylglutathione hydrolase